MKTKMLRTFVALLLTTLATVTAWADVNVDGIKYYLENGGYTAHVTGCTTTEVNIKIPSVVSYEGTIYTVTAVSMYAFKEKPIKTVILPNTITEIGLGAFKNCKDLTSVDLGGSVKSIKTGAFNLCTSLKSVNNCNSVENIESDAFYKTPWIDNQPDGVVYIGKALYRYNGSMPSNTSITIKDGTTQICENAFTDYSKLVAVKIPNTVTRIERHAFYKCINLASISIPQSVESVGAEAFGNTMWLNSQPTGTVYINNSLYTYNGEMHAGTSVNIKNGTKAISAKAFEGQTNMTSVTIPNSVTEIGQEAFAESGITSIILPNSITQIDDLVFFGCSNLTTVTLPVSIKSIGYNAFGNCCNLKTVTCLSTRVPSTETAPFNNVPLAYVTLYVPESALENYKVKSPWEDFGTIKSLEEMEDAVAPTLSRSQLHVSSTTYSSVTLTWIKATDNFTPKEDLLYSVYVNGELFKQERDIASCVVTDLKPSTSYTFQVSVEDLRGNVTKYDGVRATTEAKPVVIEKYPILIEYTQVTSENATDFWGDGGSIKYDPATKTLTLAWADLSSTDDAICIYDDITIKLIGQNTVYGSIYADYTGDLAFTGDGSISVKGENPLYGWISSLVLKDGCTVELDATGYDSPGLGLDDCLLGVDHSTLKVKGGMGNRSIRAVTTFWMDGSEFETNHSYDKVKYMFLDAKGKEATDEIIIAPIIKKIPMIADNTITMVNVDDNSATVAWMAATDDTTPQSELTYYIYSMKYGDYDFMYDADSKGMTSYTYTNLKPGTTYYVRVKVVDKDDNQVFYQDASFTTTTPDTSAPALSDNEIRVTDVTENSIAIEWTKASDDRTADDQLVYEVVYADNSSFADNYLMVQVDKNTATLRKLSPSTTYYIKVSVRDEASNQSEYRVLSVTTAPPSAINEVTAESGDEKMYSPSGVRVSENFRGIVIKNAKKVMVKE